MLECALDAKCCAVRRSHNMFVFQRSARARFCVSAVLWSDSRRSYRHLARALLRLPQAQTNNNITNERHSRAAVAKRVGKTLRCVHAMFSYVGFVNWGKFLSTPSGRTLHSRGVLRPKRARNVSVKGVDVGVVYQTTQV